MNRSITVIASITLILIAAAFSPGCTSSEPQDTDTLYQVSVFNLLLAGEYDGTVTIDELKEQGDLGLGTIDHLDGEMVALDGAFYTVRSDGTVIRLDDDMTVPFADVTFFEKDLVVPMENIPNITVFEERLENSLPSKNIIYAIRMEGTFPYVKTRAVPRQDPPYPPLVEVVKNQSVFENYNITGTVVGFWSPSFVSGLSVPGYHIHFISSDFTKGGHLLDIRIDNTAAELDATTGSMVALPENSMTDAKIGAGDLAAVEK